MTIDPTAEEALQALYHIIAPTADSWAPIKKYLFCTLHPRLRRQFTKVNPDGSFTPNEFERELIRYWVALTNRPFVFTTNDGTSETIHPE